MDVILQDLPARGDAADTSKQLLGIVDIGSNSVRFVVFDLSSGMPVYYFNEKVMCGLASRLTETGMLCPDAKPRALRAISRFKVLADRMELPLHAIATAALRDAQDGEDFRQEILNITGLDVKIISGVEEARLAAQGVCFGMPDATGLVADLGGGSLELSQVANGVVKAGDSLPYGILRFVPEIQASLKDRLRDVEVIQSIAGSKQNLYLVGGSWRAIAKIHMAHVDYPIPVVNDYTLSQAEALKTIDWIQKSTLDDMPVKLSSVRLSALKPATFILRELIECLDPKTIVFSALGVREGMLVDILNLHDNQTDTFIETCRVMEMQQARCCGFGDELFQWLSVFLQQVLPDQIVNDPVFKRRVHAACLLSDLSWRMHPDYRAQSCFELATRIYLMGIEHEDRVWIGAALLHRHKGGKKIFEKNTACQRLSRNDKFQTTLVGRAMRLGVIFAAGQKGNLHGTALNYDKKAGVSLDLSAENAFLHGEVVEKHLKTVSKTISLYMQDDDFNC
jgi:exopolyphosphatase/guanosine-5'-triphosphate,3'-diphosphate pyrophosphatase